MFSHASHVVFSSPNVLSRVKNIIHVTLSNNGVPWEVVCVNELCLCRTNQTLPAIDDDCDYDVVPFELSGRMWTPTLILSSSFVEESFPSWLFLPMFSFDMMPS